MSGLPVVALHSIGLDAHAFDGLDAALRREVIALDLPGHGGASSRIVDDLGAVVDDVVARLPDEPFHLVGHSLGGVIAGLACPRSSAVSLAILASPSSARPAFAERAQAETVPVAETLTRWFPADELALEGPAVLRARDCLSTTSLDGWRAGWHVLTQFEGVGALAVDVPTLCLSALDDTSTPPEESSAFAEAVPGAGVITIPSGGHAFPLTRPTETATILDEWFATVEGGAR